MTPPPLTFRSPAKLNLMLHITAQRDDGYHLLQTVFQFIDLYDHLTFEITDHGSITRSVSQTPVNEADDIILLAAKLLKSKYQISLGLRYSIEKHIPIGGGLGGGSSNAATTLMVLNKLWGLNLGRSELATLGLELGADVPIFIEGKAAWASGIGEDLTPIDLPKPWYVVIYPQIFVSTGEIFASEQLTRNCDPITIRAFLAGAGRNVCEPIACQLYPDIKKAIDWLSQYSKAKMTGTGASIFASFDSLEQAERVRYLAPEYWSAFVVKAMNRNPVIEQCELL
ncbi:MAG: 4-diphosphocytidyl-2-C-methyl-D-erythritol kinase [Urechidicola sp.]|jgi:4-diphosphocytidyl-2-C-methyl-D-erythritol kinase